MDYSDERINELPFTEKIFAFADINSNLQVRCKGALYSFNDEDRLREILKNHAFPRTLGNKQTMTSTSAEGSLLRFRT